MKEGIRMQEQNSNEKILKNVNTNVLEVKRKSHVTDQLICRAI